MGSTTSEIRGARVSPAGVPLGGTSLTISTNAMMAYAPKVAFDGTNYLVVWYELYGAAIHARA
jgi:hypothetical protein